MLPLAILDRRLDYVCGGSIRECDKSVAKIFMDVLAHERIHLVTPRTDGGYVFLG